MTDTTTAAPSSDTTTHQHVFEDRWYPLDRRRVRRVCVLPDCHHVEVKEATA